MNMLYYLLEMQYWFLGRIYFVHLRLLVLRNFYIEEADFEVNLWVQGLDFDVF